MGDTYSCRVKTVLDGDSLIANCGNKVVEIRLQHIDAPELLQDKWGIQSRQQLKKILANKTFTAVFHEIDVYQRYIATISIADIDVNQLMVEQGYARVYSKYHPPVQYIQSMKNAKSNRLGIWQTEGLQQDPQRFRRLSLKTH